MATALSWDDRFGVHDMGEAALFVPVGGLVEADVHIDNPAGSCARAPSSGRPASTSELVGASPSRGEPRRDRPRPLPGARRAHGRDRGRAAATPAGDSRRWTAAPTTWRCSARGRR